MVLLSKSLLDPTAIQKFNPDQLAVVVNYTVNNGSKQMWVMCDEFPYRIFVIPERQGFPFDHILDTLDQHFDNLVFYPSQQQFIKSSSMKADMQRFISEKEITQNFYKSDAAKFGIHIEIEPGKIAKALIMKILTLLSKLIQIGYEIIKLAARNILLLVGFAGKHLLRLFLSIMVLLVDCYEAIPVKEEAMQQRAAADNLREDIEILDNIRIMDKILPDVQRTIGKILQIIKGQVEEAEDFKDDFMKELDRDIPLTPADGYRRRI